MLLSILCFHSGSPYSGCRTVCIQPSPGLLFNEIKHGPGNSCKQYNSLLIESRIKFCGAPAIYLGNLLLLLWSPGTGPSPSACYPIPVLRWVNTGRLSTLSEAGSGSPGPWGGTSGRVLSKPVLTQSHWARFLSSINLSSIEDNGEAPRNIYASCILTTYLELLNQQNWSLLSDLQYFLSIA